MNQTLVHESDRLLDRLLRPVVKVLRLVYIQGTTIVKLLPSEKAIQLYYKLRHKSYDFQWSIDPGFRKGLDRLVELGIEEGDRVLDVGCGTGLATFVVAGKAREVVGIDLSPHMIERATKKTSEMGVCNTTFLTASVEEYQPDRPFDKVISSFMLPHVKPELRPAIYSCMFNFLKPGGVLCLYGSRGEVCDVYETCDEMRENLTRSGFTDFVVHDVWDIYRIGMARKPLQ